MFVIERQQEIINIIKNKKSVSVAELSRHFFISEAAIRRDLTKLERMGLLKRIYGGAVLLEGLDSEIPLYVRETEQKQAKDVIGEIASRLVTDGNILIMDSSSTTLKMVPHLKSRSNLTVITNGAKTALELGENPHIKVYSTGGRLRENSLSYVGNIAMDCISRFFVDTVFFSCRALSMDAGLTDSSEDEALLRKIMMRSAKKVVLLCDHTKFDQVSFCKISSFDSIKYVVTDKQPSARWMDFLGQQSIKLLCP